MGDCSEIFAPSPTTEHDVPDELLELVFLRLPSSLHLVHAACTCKRWRRIIAHAAFLRRFRSLRGSPLVAGHYRVDACVHWSRPPGCNPVFFLSPSSDAVGLRPQHFSLDFLPSRDGLVWDVADSRGGLLLASQCPGLDKLPIFRDLVVCEPVTRRCRVIPPPTSFRDYVTCGAFLLDGDADEAAGGRISLSNFRIIVALVLKGIAVAFVFSSCNGDDTGWMIPIPMGGLVTPKNSIYFQAQAAQSIYWSTEEDEIVALDKDTEEFSYSLLPEEAGFCRRTFVGCDGGKVRLVCLDYSHLRVFIQAEGADEWVLEKGVELQQLVREVGDQDDGELQVNMLQRIISVAEGSVLLCTEERVKLVSVDLATMESKRVVQDNDKYLWPAYMYQLPWPPTFQACLD